MRNVATRKVMLLAGWALALWTWERWHALRPQREPAWRRDLRNVAVAGTAALAVQAAEAPLARRLLHVAEKRGWGVTRALPLPNLLQDLLAVALLDYTLYLWHVLTHRVPLLWRFHQVHHRDREMDASTALRFHGGEMLLSVPWRGAQVLAIGPGARAYGWWQAFLFASILFHHSNARLPLAVERLLARVLVTPRLHGIHHSVVESETSANWSSGLTCWDWLHGTLRTQVPQETLVLGVADRRDESRTGLPALLAAPLTDPVPTPRPGAATREALAHLA